MAKHCEDLPPDVELGFPAYALGAQFDGYRWLAGWEWDKRGWVSSVGLGHGGPARKSGFVVVHTFVKSSYDHFTPPFGEQVEPSGRPRVLYSAGPTGYRGALWRAVTSLTQSSPHESSMPASERGTLIGDLVDEADWANPQADWMHRPDQLSEAWTATMVTVDGNVRSADTRQLDGRWATLVDLPTVAVSISGPDGMRDLATPLIDARGTIATYK